MPVMSVAKPTLEYVKTIRVKLDLARAEKTLKVLLNYQKKYIHYLIAVVLLSILRSYLFTLEPKYTAQIIDDVVVGGQYDLLLGLVLKIVFSVMGFALTNFAIAFLQGASAHLVIRDIRKKYYDSLQEKSFGFYDSSAVGDLISRATMDLQSVQAFYTTWLGTVCDAIFTTSAVFMVMYPISPRMSLIAFITVPIVFFFQATQFTKTMPMFRKMMLILGRLGAYIQQNIIGMKNVRIFRREKEMEDGFKQVEEIYVDTAITAGRIQSLYTPSAEATLSLGIAMVYVYGATLIASPSSMLTIGEIILFSRYMMRLTMPMRNLSQLTGTFINAIAGFERTNEIINMPVDVKDQPEAQEITINKGEVEFRSVNFEYVKGRAILKNVNFKTKPGEKIAILGATGSGKTSMVYLIPRFYDVSSGSILIDGVDVRNYKLSSLRRQIGLVLQDVFLFAGTLRDNIAFGNPDAPMENVVSAAKFAHIHDFIESLPEGYDSIVGERGVTLSGGQKQRITIARALLTNPKILILDDSLSFVDAKTEHEIQQAIEEAMKDRTTFIIAQRLSTIKNADRILVLDNGEVAEFGTHSELMTKGGIYKRIYETQFLDKAPEEILVGGAR
jgi:ATP-binding cassette subfamily B protein